MKKLVVIISIILLLSLLVSCGQEIVENSEPSIKVEASSETSEEGDMVVESSSSESDSGSSVGESASESSGSEKTSVIRTESKEETSDLRQNNYQAGQMTSGEWNDNDNFDYFMNILNDNEWYYMKEHWGFVNWKRYEFEVVNHDKAPIINARIDLYNDQSVLYSGRTDNNGKVILYPYLNDQYVDASSVQAKISYNQSIYEIVDLNAQDDSFKVTIDEKAAPVSDVDIMLVIDTTGSMSDELMYLKNEFADVIKRVDDDQQNQLNFRLSSNFYRDRGDQYVTKSYPFTHDLDDVIKQLKDQEADGGGDYEEAVVDALYDGVFDHDWYEEAETKLLFLVLDAPPHHTDQNISGIHHIVEAANEKGIKVIPIASSGVDKNTEFLLRFLSTSTGGTYTFLTDHSGIGNSHITPTIGHYQVEQLNQMMIRLINKYVE